MEDLDRTDDFAAGDRSVVDIKLNRFAVEKRTAALPLGIGKQAGHGWFLLGLLRCGLTVVDTTGDRSRSGDWGKQKKVTRRTKTEVAKR